MYFLRNKKGFKINGGQFNLDFKSPVKQDLGCSVIHRKISSWKTQLSQRRGGVQNTLQILNWINVKQTFVLTISFLLLQGCWWNQNQPVPPSGSYAGSFTNKTYVVDRLEGAGYLSYKEGFPHTFTLLFDTCITDSKKSRTSVPINTKFIIEYETAEKSGDSYKKVTRRTPVDANEGGCIRWSEEYPYKYVFKSRWIGLNRIIEGSDGSFYHGKEIVETAVNPWIFETEEGGEFPSVIDRRPLYYDQHAHILQRYPYEEEGLEFLMEGAVEYPQLWVANIDLQMRFAKDHLDRKDLSKEELIKSYTTLCGFDEHGNKVNFIEGESLCYNRKLIMDLAIPLQILTLGVKGKGEGASIDGGTYNIKAYLVVQPEGVKEDRYYLLHREKYLEKKNVSKGHSTEGTYQSTEFLTVEFPVNILFGHFNATYKLILEIENNDGLFKKFEGVYTLGDKIQIGSRQGDVKNDNWLIAQYKSLFRDKNFQTGDKAIHEIASMELASLFNGPEETQKEILKRLKKMGFHTNQLEVIVNDGEIRFANVKSNKNCYESENVIERIIEYSVTANFKDFFEKDPKRVPFRVIIENPSAKNPADRLKEIRKKTDGEEGPYFTHSGASIKIYDELYHKNYNRQIYTERKIHYISEDGQFYGQARVGLNPWQGQFQFGKDLTTASGIRTKRNGVPFPRLVINQFRAINFFPFYLIDKLLNIHISHNYYFLFQVIIQRPDNIEHGRHPMGREFIRDGYHLARVLIIRNPLEADTVKTVSYLEDYNKKREELLYNESLEPSFVKGGEYLSHVDTVINVRGNWVNIYVPAHFNHQQFIYLASRNQIAIQVYPADPRGFVYKEEEVGEGQECELNLEKTVWRPYFSCRDLGTNSLESDDCHELEIMPHTAAMQTNDWQNWNVLRRAPLLNTDMIIDQSELGKKRRHFTLHPLNGTRSPLKNPSKKNNLSTKKDKLLVVNPRPARCSVEPAYPGMGAMDAPAQDLSGRSRTPVPVPGKGESDECFGDKTQILALGDPADFMTDKTPVVDVVEELEKKPIQKTAERDGNTEDILPEILRQFADDNALKIVDLSKPEEAQKLVSDLNETGIFFEEQSKEISVLLSQQISSSTEVGENPNVHGQAMGDHSAQETEGEAEALSAALTRLLDMLGSEKLGKLKQEIHAQCRPEEEEWEQGIWWKIKTSTSRFFSLEDKEESGTGEDTSWGESFSNTWSSITEFSAKDFFLSKMELGDFAKYYNECSLGLIRKELETVIGKYTDGSDATDESQDRNAVDAVREVVERNSIVQMYEPIKEENDAEFLIKTTFLIVAKTTQNQIASVVNRGVTTKNYKEPVVGSFIHNLCQFWFDKYFSEYLTSKQMMVAYTNFIKKFDYNEILENRDLTYSNFDVDGLFNFLGVNEAKGPGQCVQGYSNCLLNVRCDLSDSLSCGYRTKEDSSCTHFIQNQCPYALENPLCNKLIGFSTESDCQRRVSLYCRQNSDKEACHHYNSRCWSSQKQCVLNLEDWFEELKTHSIFRDLTLFKDGIPVFSQTPLKTCLANPFEFFRFERKMAVLELDTDSFEYVGGIPFSASISSSHSITSAMRWSGSTSTSISIGPTASADIKRSKSEDNIDTTGVGKGGKGKTKHRAWAFDFGLRLGLDGKWGMSSSASNSGGNDLSIRVLEGAYINVHQSIIKMDVKKFKKCLVIKPRPNAFFSHLKDNGLREEYEETTVWDTSFYGNDMKKIAVSRPGLLICNPVEEREPDNPETIMEHYYYLAQEPSKNMEFLFLYDIRNRPYTMIFRGQKEFFKYFSLIRELRGGRDPDGKLYNFSDEVPVNFFSRYSYPIEEMVGLNYTIRALNETGFQPGIYTYPDRDWINTEFFRKNTSVFQSVHETLRNTNPFQVVSPTTKQLPVQPWGMD